MKKNVPLRKSIKGVTTHSGVRRGSLVAEHLTGLGEGVGGVMWPRVPGGSLRATIRVMGRGRRGKDRVRAFVASLYVVY